MKKVSVKDKELKTQDISNLILSILFTQDGLSYSLFSPFHNKYVALESYCYQNKTLYLDEVETFLSSHDLLGINFLSVNVLISSLEKTIVPSELFDKDNVDIFWKLNFEAKSETEILYSKLIKSSNVLIFSIDKQLKYKLNFLFPKYNLMSISQPFIETSYTKSKVKENASSCVYIQVFEEYADVLVTDNTEIKLFNSFAYKSYNDLFYYIIRVFEQLKLSQNKTELIFSGFIDNDEAMLINLSKFIEIIFFESQNVDYKYHYRFQEILPHYFYSFLNIN